MDGLRVAGWIATGSMMLAFVAFVSEAKADTPNPNGGEVTAASETNPPPKEELRGPANNIVVEASIGYAAGAFTAIDGHDPRVAYGPMFHFGLGYAWPIKRNQSVGIEAIADGTLDGDKTTNMGGHVSGRFGGAAFVYGEHAHLRVIFGYAHAALDGQTYGGIGVGFGAGWHVPLGDKGNKKHVAFIAELAPSWDFLGAGSQTLHRWNFGLVFGIAVI